MSVNYNRAIRCRYVSTQRASSLQVGLIRKLFYQLEKYDKSKKDYSSLNHYEADSIIRSLKTMVRSEKAKRKKCRKKRQSV